MAQSCSVASPFKVPWGNPPKGTSFKFTLYLRLCIELTCSTFFWYRAWLVLIYMAIIEEGQNGLHDVSQVLD